MTTLFYQGPRWLSLVLAMCFFGPMAQAQQAEDLIARLQAKYESITALRADFAQTLDAAYFDQPEATTGRLYLQGDSYRLETAGQTLVTDGETVFIYSAADAQMLINDYVEDETTFSVRDFFFNHTERYDVATAGARRADGVLYHVLELTPKRPDSFFQQVTLWMRDADNLIARVEVVDINETRMGFTLTDIQLNPALPDDTFELAPPEGTEVIDLRG